MKKAAMPLLAGLILGAVLATGSFANAAEAFLKAYPSTHVICLDGKKIEVEAYVINGSNYVRLGDIGEAMDFNVYWDDTDRTVQIDSDAAYTGQPSTNTVPAVEDSLSDLGSARYEIIDLVNQIRRKHGLQELTVNQALMDAAQERAETLYTYHRNQEDCEAALAHGYPHGFGANIAALMGSAADEIAQDAVSGWINSPGHYQTMIDPGGDTIGVGVAEDRYKTVCYLFIGNPMTHNPYE